ncbi:MAG: DNA repair protein RecN [Ilumatobacteraceae bacterium]|nr:DNA repair protein RecN [Ilumatobacteraceae bacterium]
MLTELHIENLGVIDRLELILGPGLTALTGETGAGKTMLVDAIELLVGGRADSTIVRHGATEARIDGRLVAPDGTETVLTRIIPASGRSRAYLNGRLATVASLAEAASDAVDLHGQHAHQSLLSMPTQRGALDEFGEIDLTVLSAARARLVEVDAELAALGGDERGRAREIDLLRYQVDELNDASLVGPEEDEQLDAEESILADAVAHREAGRAALAALVDDDGGRDSIAAALAALDGRSPFERNFKRLQTLLAELDDIAGEVRETTDLIDESPERLDALRERRQLLKNLLRKYGADLESVLLFQVEAEQRLRELLGFDERAAALDVVRQQALADERLAAAAVGDARRAAAPQLAQAVEARLQELAMPDAAIAIEVGEHAEDNPADRIQFLLAANPGSPLLPLNRVASGGELARAMLALRLVLSGVDGDKAAVGTLVFDEVDAGIGGAAAQSIGDALGMLGNRHQVLVVTHLAQVAAAGDAQISVSKQVSDGITSATAVQIEGDERVDEIARMLSGSHSKSAREHARELLS